MKQFDKNNLINLNDFRHKIVLDIIDFEFSENDIFIDNKNVIIKTPLSDICLSMNPSEAKKFAMLLISAACFMEMKK